MTKEQENLEQKLDKVLLACSFIDELDEMVTRISTTCESLEYVQEYGYVHAFSAMENLMDLRGELSTDIRLWANEACKSAKETLMQVVAWDSEKQEAENVATCIGDCAGE